MRWPAGRSSSAHGLYERASISIGRIAFTAILDTDSWARIFERSPLPFARHRWVSSGGPADIDIAETPRRRAGVSAWADERAHLPIDPELGPSWHLGVLPIEEMGPRSAWWCRTSSPTSLGICLAIADAVEGRKPDFGYPPPGSRTRGRALLQDSRQTARAVPEMARALIGAVRVARRNRQALASSIASAPLFPARGWWRSGRCGARSDGLYRSGGMGRSLKKSWWNKQFVVRWVRIQAWRASGGVLATTERSPCRFRSANAPKMIRVATH